jgi:hypothetical protein
MAMGLQDGIDLAGSQDCEARVLISMHDASGLVLFGSANPTFRPDLPLLGGGTATIGGRGAWLRRGLTPGFSTRGNPTPGPNEQENQFVASDRTTPAPPNQTQLFRFDQPIAIDLSVRRDPGFPALRWFGLGPSVQIEIETLSAPGGAVVNAVTLNAVEDGLLSRALGTSVQNPGLSASYTVTLDVWPVANIG